jgi:ATP-dependent DNA helicase RecQ
MCLGHDETCDGDRAMPVALESSLKRHFGYDRFLPGQRQVIEHLLAGRSAAAVFPTGGGKSLCYQLPALLLPGLTLVVSPLIALMKDQIDALRARGVAAERLDSTLSASEQSEVAARARSGALRLLYVAPERFNNERFRATVQRLPIALFAVDEAHCISEWGHNFRPDYLKLALFARRFGAERLLALTATATPRVLADMCRAFEIAPECAVRSPLYRANLTLRATPVAAADRGGRLLELLAEREPGPTIVYVTLQRTAEALAASLAAAGLPARPYHAGLPDEERHAVQDWFMGSKHAVVVATIAFGMGIDKADIRYVYHYNLPKSLESYSQEIGRAGRDGRTSLCHVLVCPDDLCSLENFAYGVTPSAEAIGGLVRELFGQGEALALDLRELSTRHDINELALHTLLTYLELGGYLEAGTPFYATYRFKPLTSSREILARVDGERRRFLAGLLKRAVKARTWFDIDPAEAAAALGTERERIIGALTWLGEQKLLEVKVTGIRHRYRKIKAPQDLEELTRTLSRRVLQRERSELERLRQVLELMGHDGCQTAALVAHFGEELAAPCGHCEVCLDGPIAIPARRSADIDADLWQQAESVRAEHREVLAEPRRFVHFLCGIRSPLLGRTKLPRHRLFGALAEVPFGVVLSRASSRR